MSYNVIVCGSRYYDDSKELNRVLDSLKAKKGTRLKIIVGGAVGADELARRWAFSRKVDHEVVYARWDEEGKGAGFNRNERMLKKKPKLVIAFRIDSPSENRGTDHMCGIAEAAGVRVKRFTA